MRRILIALAGVAALVLSGCTPSDEATTLSGVQLACTLAGVGSQVAVTVITKGQSATIAQTVGSGVAAGCAALVPAVQAEINKLTAAGDVATVQVTTTPANGAPVSMRFKVRKALSGAMYYTVQPNALATFFNQLGL